MSRTCRLARRWILLQVDGRSSLEDDFRLEEHLRECPACAAEHRRTNSVERLLHGLDEPDPERLDLDGALASIRARIAAGSPSAPRRRTSLAWLASVAAVLLSTLVLVARSAREEPGPDAPEVVDLPRPTEAPRLVAAPELAPPPLAEPEAERVRLADARSRVRADLLRVADAWSSEDLARRLEAAAETWNRGDWHLLRLVEELTDEEELPLARAAVRYLAARGDALTVPLLRGVLERAELAEEGFAALTALGTRGDAACPVMGRLLTDPARGARALEALVAVGTTRAARELEAVLRSAPWDADLEERLLDGLVRIGAPAVESLVALAADDAVAPGECARRAAPIDGADAELERIVREDPRALPVPVLLAFATELRPTGLLPRVEELCESYRDAPLALATLGRWRGRPALESLLRLDARGRVPDEDLAWVLRLQLDESADEVTDFARELLAARRALDARRLLELLVLSEHPASARPLAALGLSDVLTDDVRQLALLAIAELGPSARLDELLERLAADPPEDTRLFACGLVSLHAVLGPEPVDRVLAQATDRGRQQVQEALERARRRGVASGLTRVTRALEGAWSDPFETWQGLP